MENNVSSLYSISQEKKESGSTLSLLRNKLTASTRQAQTLRSKLPRFAEKDLVWVNEKESGVVKKVKGTWNSTLKKVVAIYYVEVIKPNGKKKIVRASEKDLKICLDIL